jgi:hypothetical protein
LESGRGRVAIVKTPIEEAGQLSWGLVSDGDPVVCVVVLGQNTVDYCGVARMKKNGWIEIPSGWLTSPWSSAKPVTVTLQPGTGTGTTG